MSTEPNEIEKVVEPIQDVIERLRDAQRRRWTGDGCVTIDNDDLDRLIGCTTPSGEGRAPEVREGRDLRAYQERVSTWMLVCFARSLAMSKKERAQRFLEEALELAQAEGLTRDDADLMVNYVYSRPVGKSPQEVGGVMVTLAALCWNAEIDLEAEAFKELERVEQPEIIEKIRKKQASKSAILGITADPAASAALASLSAPAPSGEGFDAHAMTRTANEWLQGNLADRDKEITALRAELDRLRALPSGEAVRGSGPCPECSVENGVVTHRDTTNAGAAAQRSNQKADSPALRALEDIARQKLTEEMGSEGRLTGDFPGAYDQMIQIARAALAEAPYGEPGGSLAEVINAWGSQGLRDIANERRRQIEVEGWTPAHDDAHSTGELARAAACYADPIYEGRDRAPAKWPWADEWWKPKNRRQDLVRAGALINAEIDRLDRAALGPSRPSDEGSGE